MLLEQGDLGVRQVLAAQEVPAARPLLGLVCRLLAVAAVVEKLGMGLQVDLAVALIEIRIRE